MPARFLLAAVMAGIFAMPALADEASPLLVIHNKQFEPKELPFPAGVKLKLVVRNLDAVPIEFESYDLSREVVVPEHGEVTVYVGPLEPGSYQFFNDFDHAMQGLIVVKPTVVKRR